MSTLNEQVAEIGLRGFIRATILAELKIFTEKKQTTDEFMENVNKNMLNKFKVVAQDEFMKVLKEVSKEIKKKEK